MKWDNLITDSKRSGLRMNEGKQLNAGIGIQLILDEIQGRFSHQDFVRDLSEWCDFNTNFVKIITI